MVIAPPGWLFYQLSDQRRTSTVIVNLVFCALLFTVGIDLKELGVRCRNV